MRVKKRDGSIVAFDMDRIIKAAKAAMDGDTSKLEEFERVFLDAMGDLPGDTVLNVETVSDMVEKSLMKVEAFEAAKRFILYRNQRAKIRSDVDGEVPAEQVMKEYILASKYARHIEEEGRRETFGEIVDRVFDMHKRRIKDAVDLEPVKQAVLAGGLLPSMRSMQFAGAPLEDKHARMYNCSYSVADRTSFFMEFAYLLLCGCGCGFSVEKRYTDKLVPIPASFSEDSIVKFEQVRDSIEGWAEAIASVIYYATLNIWLELDYSNIRRKGSPVSAGGKAPGHLPLKRAVEKIREILLKAAGRGLKPIEVYDICMFIADAVVSGGIRRSACICLFDPDDEEMATAKTGNWFEVNPQRCRSNNSAKILIDGNEDKATFDRLFNMQKEWGEPGFYFARDPDQGANPCVEIGMKPFIAGKSAWQFCNLVEINGVACENANAFWELCRHAAVLATVQSDYTDLPIHAGRYTRALMEEVPLLGVSITGVMDNPDVLLDEEVLKKGARIVRETNEEVAEKIGILPAIRTTCIKPAGTTSLVFGSASGMHPRHARRYLRRVQTQKNDPVLLAIQSANPGMVFDSIYSNRDAVVEFPIKSPDSAILREDMSALDMLDVAETLQKNWVLEGDRGLDKVHHNVSCTITVRDNEWSKVQDRVWHNRSKYTGIAMLPYKGDHIYPQAPHESVDDSPVTREHWDFLRAQIKPIGEVREGADGTSFQQVAACAGGNCEL